VAGEALGVAVAGVGLGVAVAGVGLGVAVAGEALGAAVTGEALGGAVVLEGEGDVDGLADGEPADVPDGDGLADGMAVGPSAIAGVVRNDRAKATARSGPARRGRTCKAHGKTAARASESGHKSPERAGEPRLGLLAHFAGRTDAICRDLAGVVLSEESFGLVLTTLRTHRDHEPAGHEFAVVVGAGPPRDERNLVVGEALLLQRIDRGLGRVTVREDGDNGDVLTRDVDLLDFVFSCFHHDLRVTGRRERAS
jgi:hypothetical protein